MKTLRHLLADIIDYAGLFPPAKLDMKTAVENYAAYREAQESWMLGRFVVPASRLEELEDAAEDLLPAPEEPPLEHPWELSVLTGANPDKAMAALDPFLERNEGGALKLGAIEAVASTPQEVEHSQKVLPGGVPIFFEIPVDKDPAPLVEALAKAGAQAKIRTGGVTPEAFPPEEQVAAFLQACSRHKVAFKATAGLHHPLRGLYRLTYEPDSASGNMYGFLNVFLAASLLSHGSLKDGELTQLLLESDPASLEVSPQGIHWRGHEVTTEQLAETRSQFAMSYGSCSFQEPVDDLKGLSLL